MSRRFGRNQKRKLREQIANLTTARNIDAQLLAYCTEKRKEVEETLAYAYDTLVQNSVALPADTVEISYPRKDVELVEVPPLSFVEWKDEPITQTMKVERLPIILASVHNNDHPFQKLGKHVMVEFDGRGWGYAIDYAALMTTPHKILVERVSSALAMMISEQLKIDGYGKAKS